MWSSPTDVSVVLPLATIILKILNVEIKNYKKNEKRNLRNQKRKRILNYTPKLIYVI
jgi:hypothetical protein